MTSRSNVAGVRCQTLGALVETGWGCLVLFSLVVSDFVTMELLISYQGADVPRV